MSKSAVLDAPLFDFPHDDDDIEIWCLRAPSHLDVFKLLNEVTIQVDSTLLISPSTSVQSSKVISNFRVGTDGDEYSLSLVEANELVDTRLLVRNPVTNDENNQQTLVPFSPFKGQLNLTCVLDLGSRIGESSSNVQSDLRLAPAKDSAPKPAFEQSGNGKVDSMRLAYMPVPQRNGLKRRWVMPGAAGILSSATLTPQIPQHNQDELFHDEYANRKDDREQKKKRKNHN